MQGLTPTFTFTFPADTVDFSEASNIYVTFEQGRKKLTKSGEDVAFSTNELSVYLSQADTLQFNDGPVLIQANWTYAGGQRGASKPKSVTWDRNLLPEVLA